MNKSAAIFSWRKVLALLLALLGLVAIADGVMLVVEDFPKPSQEAVAAHQWSEFLLTLGLVFGVAVASLWGAWSLWHIRKRDSRKAGTNIGS